MNPALPVCLVASCLLLAHEARAGDWPQFRGPSGNGVADPGPPPPTSWNRGKNIKWRAPLPAPGNGSPIVSNGRVFVTQGTEMGTRRSLLCFDRQTGRELWTRTIEFDKRMPTHDTNPHGSSTPASDGQRVVVWHASAGLHCYDFAGKQLWSRDLGEFRHMWGYGTSPVIHEGRVLLNSGPGTRVFLAAFDLATGKTLWEANEPVPGIGEKNDQNHPIGSWTTPVVATIEGKRQVLCSFNSRLNGYDPESGKLLWTCDGIKGRRGELAYSSPMMAGDICVAIGGFQGPSLGARPGGEGNITEARRLWRNESNPQSIGSGVYVGKHLYVPDAGPAGLRCIEPATGRNVWEERGANRTFWGSVVASDGHLYVTSQAGDTVVFKPDPERYVEVAVNALGEACNTTPAVSDGEVFIRTANAVYCIASLAGTALSAP